MKRGLSRKSVGRILGGVAGGYLAVCGIVFLIQRTLMYGPPPTGPTERTARDAGLPLWPSATEFRGYLADAPKDWRGTVAVFHGNGSGAFDLDFVRDALAPLGYRVLLAEYPGYAGRPGTIDEAWLVSDGRETVRRAAALGKPVFVWGISLGTGVASAVAADRSLPIRGLALITPFDSMTEQAAQRFWMFPSRWMVRDRYDSVANLQGFSGPVAVLIAENDRVVAPERGRRLFDSLQTPKKLWRFPGVGHNDWPSDENQSWWSEVAAFLESD